MITTRPLGKELSRAVLPSGRAFSDTRNFVRGWAGEHGIARSSKTRAKAILGGVVAAVSDSLWPFLRRS